MWILLKSMRICCYNLLDIMLGKSSSLFILKNSVNFVINIFEYSSLFSATKHDADIAMRASKAYKNIIDALFDAQQALNDANNVINILSDRVSTLYYIIRFLFVLFWEAVGRNIRGLITPFHYESLKSL